MNTIARTITLFVLFCAGILTGLWVDRKADIDAVAHTSEASGGERKPLYYRNPMGLPDISPVPKKDSMGMDYIPVYANEAEASIATDHGTLHIPAARVQKMGVRSEVATHRPLDRTLTALGVIEADERTLASIAPRFSGWIETLQVNETGHRVRRGEILFEAYSPELLTAQQDYLIALEAADTPDQAFATQLLRTARMRLLNAHFDETQIRELERRREPLRTVALRAPRDGVVLERSAVSGMRFAAGETLFRTADLDTVWLIANVPEQDVGEVRRGQAATLSIDGLPGRLFKARVGFVYPTLDPATRTVRVRIELSNTDLQLRPGMYGHATLHTHTADEPVLTVPESAVLDSGLRQIVLVDHGEGSFEPRPVVIGRRGTQYVEVLSGLSDGERVVTRANFLIDAESNLQAALADFSSPDSVETTEDSTVPTREHHHGHGGH